MSCYIESSYITEKRYLLNKKRALRLELDDLFNELFSIIDFANENLYWKSRINKILDNLLKIYKSLNDFKSDDDENNNNNNILNVEDITELLRNLKIKSDNNNKINSNKHTKNETNIALDEITNSNDNLNEEKNNKIDKNNLINISKLNSLFQQLSLVKNKKTVKIFENKRKKF